MAKWRYLTTQIPVGDMDARLDSLGADGWELVAAQPVWVHEFHRDHYGDPIHNIPPMVTLTDWHCVFKRRGANA